MTYAGLSEGSWPPACPPTKTYPSATHHRVNIGESVKLETETSYIKLCLTFEVHPQYPKGSNGDPARGGGAASDSKAPADHPGTGARIPIQVPASISCRWWHFHIFAWVMHKVMHIRQVFLFNKSTLPTRVHYNLILAPEKFNRLNASHAQFKNKNGRNVCWHGDNLTGFKATG